MKEYDIYTNVNFYDGDETNTIKKIEFEKKGGWSNKIQSGGGWIMEKVMDQIEK